MAQRIPKKITKSYLENAALHYLQRYATSSANLRKVMSRKIQRSCKHHGDTPDDHAAVLEDLIRRYAATGLVDDVAYARGRAASLRREGRSKQAIHAKLRNKGLTGAEIDVALAVADAEAGEDPEFTAALALAKRKKLGPFRIRPMEPKKELGALARAGFSYEIAQRVLGYEEED